MRATPFQTVVKHLTMGQTPRVWSFLISVFGELAQDRGARISGPLLRHITGQIGIKPDAMRVAIHRLRKDGWIDSERQGRTSTYFLTEWGRAQSASASPRIYAAEQAAEAAWFGMFNPGQPMLGKDLDGVWVSSHAVITSAMPDDAQAFATRIPVDTALPQWMTAKICDETTVELSGTFASALATIRPQLTNSPDLTILEIAAIRVLLVHGWRRIVLKTPALPDHVFPDEWQGAACRSGVAGLLTQYPKVELEELEAAVISIPTP